jgi:hypothetical protein
MMLLYLYYLFNKACGFDDSGGTISPAVGIGICSCLLSRLVIIAQFTHRAYP